MVVLLELVAVPEEELDWLPGGLLPPEVEVFEVLVAVLFALDAVPEEVTLVEVELAEEVLDLAEVELAPVLVEPVDVLLEVWVFPEVDARSGSCFHSGRCLSR